MTSSSSGAFLRHAMTFTHQSSKPQPQFQHNCSNCVFLGGFGSDTDLYLCPPPSGALGEGVFTLRTGDAVDKFFSTPVSTFKAASGIGLFNPALAAFDKALELAEQKGLLKPMSFTLTIEQSGGLQPLINELILPKRPMTLEERLLLGNFLTKRALREFKGLQLTPSLKTEISTKLAQWLKEWELIRA